MLNSSGDAGDAATYGLNVVLWHGRVSVTIKDGVSDWCLTATPIP